MDYEGEGMTRDQLYGVDIGPESRNINTSACISVMPDQCLCVAHLEECAGGIVIGIVRQRHAHLRNMVYGQKRGMIGGRLKRAGNMHQNMRALQICMRTLADGSIWYLQLTV